MLCAVCKTSFGKSLSKLHHLVHTTGITHHSLLSFKDSVDEGCFICSQIKEHIAHQAEDGLEWLDNALSAVASSESEVTSDSGRMIYYEVHRYDEVRHLGGHYFGLTYLQANVGSKTFENYLGLLPTFVFSRFLHDPTIPSVAAQSSSTADAIDLWRYWFRTCYESHRVCHRPGLWPKQFHIRLIEILGGDDTLRWRLVSGSNIKPLSYVTLSHRWGSAGLIKLVKGEIARFHQEQKESDLPQTYRDAMRVAWSLGVQYIWIDALCIIQDDDEDWRSQSSLMGLIYHHACCNIAANWGVDGRDRCFSTRPPRSKPDIDTTVTVYAYHGPEEYLVHNQDAYRSDIMHAPLNKRGWVVQERYLARRQLSFAKSQVYWECLELSASEDFPKGIPKYMQEAHKGEMTRAKLNFNFVGKTELRLVWSNLVELYSSCALTKLTDKTAALAGLANERKNAIDDVYLAGLWEKDIESQLLWKRDGESQCYHSKTSAYIAPSWSWMSLDGPVKYDFKYRSQHVQLNLSSPSTDRPIRNPSLMEVLNASVEPSGSMHSFLSGTLKLRGIAIRAVVRYAPATYAPTGYYVPESGGFLNYRLRLVDEIKATDDFFTKPITLAILWDESIPSEEFNLQGREKAILGSKDAALEKERARLEKDRAQDLLFMFASSRRGRRYIPEGLVLGKLPKVEDGRGEKYRRLGVFTTRCGIGTGNVFDPGAVVVKRLGLKHEPKFYSGWTRITRQDMNFNDERLADLVQTVDVI
ncbi:heterokaryon incompatibility protein-domain-containing protein [Nemania abortiva]|nr:heterokaryon incompatibility protein-domain-containing protein [Nemania abortiva]